MTPTRQEKTVRIGGSAFTISGERDVDGNLRFVVDDPACLLPDANDDIARRFQDALKERLRCIRGKQRAA